MPDHDDWMTPPKLSDWATFKDDHAERPFLIERERVKQWPPGSTEWAEWERFATAKERDAALSKLMGEHPIWHLRAAHWEPLRAYLCL